jgi:hypothetical protein
MKIAISCCISAVLGLMACGRSTSSTTTQLTSAPAPATARSPNAGAGSIVTSDEAVMRITNARCDREVACNNVGSDGLFIDRDACARQLGRDAYANLQAQTCAGGIDDGKLATCLADVRNERCHNPLDTIERLLSCRRRELCVD